MNRRDPQKEQRLADALAKRWRKRKRQALDDLATMQGDQTPWTERTVAHVTTLKVVELAAAEARAQQATTNVNVNLGFVRMPAAIEDRNQWEAFAQQVDRQALEAVEVKPEDKGGDE